MTQINQLVTRARRRVAYPAFAVAMGFCTLVAGLEHSSYVVSAIGLQGAAAPTNLGGQVIEPAVLTGFSASGSHVANLAFGQLDVSISHARIDQWVARLTTSLRGDFANSLTRMDKYAEMITAKLDAKQMPRDLIYLALIESNFNPNARSKVGAVGMWQFMSATARQLGLTVKGRTDERKNPDDATDAALTYLSQLHDRFGSWYLAAAAYNSGAGTVSKALKKVTGKTQGTDEDFFRILSSLPRETQDYVPKLIASARVGSNPEEYGL
ncbi:MAG: lytic transglycosylase domain-containing protein [bacterium]